MFEWIWWYFYQNLWWRYKVGINWKTVNTSRTFCIQFREWFCPHFYHRVTDWWQYEPGWQKWGFLDGSKFPIKYLYALKTFMFFKIGVLKNFTQVFSPEYGNNFKNSVFIEKLRWLLFFVDKVPVQHWASANLLFLIKNNLRWLLLKKIWRSVQSMLY